MHAYLTAASCCVAPTTCATLSSAAAWPNGARPVSLHAIPLFSTLLFSPLLLSAAALPNYSPRQPCQITLRGSLAKLLSAAALPNSISSSGAQPFAWPTIATEHCVTFNRYNRYTVTPLHRYTVTTATRYHAELVVAVDRRVTNRNLVLCGGAHRGSAMSAGAAKYLLPPRKAKAEAARYPDYYRCWSAGPTPTQEAMSAREARVVVLATPKVDAATAAADVAVVG